jgi:hypothetical protein
MTATRATIDEAVRIAFEPGLLKTFDGSTPLLDMFDRQPAIEDAIRWKLWYAITTAGGEFDEGDPIPLAGRNLYADCEIGMQAMGVPITITGHAMDAINGNMTYFDALKNELDGAAVRLGQLVETYCLAQLLAAIDDDANYAGQIRTTVHSDSVVEDAAGATLAKAQLDSIYQQLKLRPRSVKFNPSTHAIISTIEPVDEYRDMLITGIDASKPYVRTPSDQTLDAGLANHTIRYNNIPWIEVNSLAATYVLMLNRPDVMVREIRTIKLEPLGKTSDNSDWWMSWRGGLAYRDSYRAAKIENLVI